MSANKKTQMILLIGKLSLSHAPNILIDRLIDRELKFIIWKESYIIPLHKSGNRNEVSNYSGIAKLGRIPKLFGQILTNQLKFLIP